MPALLSVMILPGCHGKAPPSGAAALAPAATQADAEDGATDPCSLLDPKEVEAVLGAPLAVPPFRSTGGPDTAAEDSENCIYEAANFRYLQVDVDFSGGAQSYSMVNFAKRLLNSSPDPTMAKSIKRSFKLDDGTELSGEWDEATLTPMNCCIFNALRADQLISVDFTASQAPLAQAATLVDAAFKRIDKPLPIDGNAGVAAAREFAKRRIKPVDPCTLLTRAEVEAIIGPLLSNPVPAGTDSCTYVLSMQGYRSQYELKISWRGGYYQYRSDSHVAGAAAGVMAGMAGLARGQSDTKATQAASSVPAAPGDAWELAEDHGMAFAAVKKDVLVSVDLRGVKEDDARKLVAAVMRKI